MNIDNTLNTLIERTLKAIEDNHERIAGNMSIQEALVFIGSLMDIRERNKVYERMNKPSKACKSVCNKKSP